MQVFFLFLLFTIFCKFSYDSVVLLHTILFQHSNFLSVFLVLLTWHTCCYSVVSFDCLCCKSLWCLETVVRWPSMAMIDELYKISYVSS